jgi:hypothetical protein
MWIIYFTLDTKISEESESKLVQQKNYWVSISMTKIVYVRANQYLLFLRNAACLAEKQQIPIL